MSRLSFLALALLIGLGSSAAGFWFGFGQGFNLGITCDAVPRATISLAQLHGIESQKMDRVVQILEADVDNGLLRAYDLSEYPLRDAMGPLWGVEFQSYEKYFSRLAVYRKTHPSTISPTMFDQVPPGKEADAAFYADLAVGVRRSAGVITYMVDHYGQ
jgi:hypothetical protein